VSVDIWGDEIVFEDNSSALSLEDGLQGKPGVDGSPGGVSSVDSNLPEPGGNVRTRLFVTPGAWDLIGSPDPNKLYIIRN